MLKYTDSILQFLQYIFEVLPEVRRQSADIAGRQGLCIPQPQNRTTTPAENVLRPQPGTAEICSGFFGLYPGVDMKSTLSFILSLYSLSDTMEAYRSKMEISDELEIRKLYSCLSGAVDPARSTGCVFANFPKTGASQNKEIKASPCMSDQCRLQLAVLPSFPLVASKLKKYMQFFVDLQSYRHYPNLIRTGLLESWSSYYLKRYQGIFFWEFCAASDSLLGIVAMYAAAANPKLTAADVQLLDEACFPWLCGFESLLRAYICARLCSSTENLNFTSFYKNLKDCEERISFFAAKAEEACLKLKESSFFLAVIKILTGMYLTDPEASFGMHRIASSNMLKKASTLSVFYNDICKLARLCHIC